ncbi:MAG: hypothetical protein K2M17_04620 [Bacilli bacterium]|nr:hypothetical protein [Bacilli bacterium]
MNILILTGKFGFGHFSAAQAIRERILLEHPTYNVEVIDFLTYMYPKMSHFIYGIFNCLVNRYHALYNLVGGISSHNKSVFLKRTMAKRIDDLLKNKKANAVISTLPICSQYISAYKKMFRSSIVLNTFVTDIAINEEWISEKTDLYFVPSFRTRDYLVKKNVPHYKIVVSGIPTKASFQAKKKQSKEKRILIMGGGLGLIPCADEFLEFLSSVQHLKITLIVGSNEKMFHKYNQKYANVEVIGFTSEVYKYMQDADLIITKAGGITLFEAIQSETPLFVIKPFLKQEIGNAKFIQDKNIGEVVWHKRESLMMDILSMLRDESKLAGLRHNMRIIKAKLEQDSFLINVGKRGIIC